MERFSELYWFYLVLAIIVSVCSLTYWIYKFVVWWRRHHRRRTRRQRSRLELQERLTALRAEHDELSAIVDGMALDLKQTSVVWRPFHRRSLAARLKHLQTRREQLDRELADLEAQLAETETAMRAIRQSGTPRRMQ